MSLLDTISPERNLVPTTTLLQNHLLRTDKESGFSKPVFPGVIKDTPMHAA
jgi:hypothetical protein